MFFVALQKFLPHISYNAFHLLLDENFQNSHKLHIYTLLVLVPFHSPLCTPQNFIFFEVLARPTFLECRVSLYNMGEERPLVIDVIDNGGQWTHREWRMLRYLGCDTKIIENNTPVSELRELDALLLSGGAARVGLTGELGNCAEYLQLEIPILGICAGHQFMARYYGGDCRAAPHPEFGAMEIELAGDGGILFQNTNPKQMVWESHNDEVHVLPEDFTITASSKYCEIEAMENVNLMRFGLQFHPEVNDTEFGTEIMTNFVNFVRKNKN